ncbi:MAG: secretin N-terminal domain-containing protein, partial [Bryobacteraceae bacterium]
MNKLTVAVVLILAAAGGLNLDAKTKKGQKFLKEGKEAEVSRKYELALELYEKALLEDPSEPAYLLATKRVRFQAAMARVDVANKLRDTGKLQEAMLEFAKAYAIDPSLAIAEQELRRTKQMIEEELKGEKSAQDERGMSAAEKAEARAERRADRMLAIPELKPITNRVSTLKMNNQPVKVLYETLGKLAGINVVFDAEFQPPPNNKFTVDLSNTSLEEALELLAIQTKTFWKALSTNTIFVTNENVTKRRDYDDYVVKVFYLQNATTVQEIQEISTTVRSITEIRRAFAYNAQNAILVRGTADQVALAAKLINDLDKPRAEVVIDVIVMEANSVKSRELAAALTTGGVPGLNIPINFGRPATEEDPGQTTLPINKLNSLGSGDFSLTVPGAILKAVMSDGQTRVLQQPQVRAVEGQKASLRIGDRIPYAAGSLGSAFGGVAGQVPGGGVGINPVFSTQFN